LAIHAIAFNEYTKGNSLRLYLLLNHSILCINGSVHVFEVYTDIYQTVKQYIVNLYLPSDQVLHLPEALLNCTLFGQSLHVLLDPFHECGVSKRIGFKSGVVHVIQEVVGLVHVVHSHE